MADLCKSTSVSFPHPNPSSSCSFAGDRPKRRRVECSHSAILEGMCLLCKRAVDDEHSLPFGFLHPSLRLSHEFSDHMREVNTGAALGLRKLHLVLDLDHTLLHTIRVSNLTPEEEEERLKPVAERNTEGDIFFVGSESGDEGEGFITKLRPFVREFLRETQEMFELTVYTMGGRLYSSRMTKLLDPDGEYFSDRVIAREDCTVRGRKSLDVVLAKQSNVLILDDTATVWPDHLENLISIPPYYYFSHGSETRGVQPSFVHDEEEDEQDSKLVMALGVLKGIHRLYFDTQHLGFKGGDDVRELVRQIQSRVRDNTSGDDQAPPPPPPPGDD